MIENPIINAKRIRVARELYEDDTQIRIDDDAKTTRDESGGVWVAAWVRLPDMYSTRCDGCGELHYYCLCAERAPKKES